MQLKMFRVQRALFAISTVVLGSVSFNSLSFAATQDASLTMSPVVSFSATSAASAADAPIAQLWQQQSALTASLESSGFDRP